MRATVGIGVGASVGALAAVTFVVSISVLIRLASANATPFDWTSARKALQLVAGAGAIVGGLAGFASRFATHRISFTWCCVAISVAAALTRVAFAPAGMKTWQGTDYSYPLSLAAALLTAGVLTWLGNRAERQVGVLERENSGAPVRDAKA